MMWLFRAFCTEKVLADHDKAKAEKQQLASANLALRTTNGALAAQVLREQQGNATLKRLLDIERDANKALAARVAERDGLVARMDAELADLSGRLADALERNALIDREEDMRDEVRAKRLSDGLGDD